MNLPARITCEIDSKEMILIQGGEIVMGHDEGSEKHRPQHSVRVKSFYIDRYPVTNQDYKRFVDDTGHPVPHYDVGWCNTRDYNWNPDARTFPAGKADHPVVLVTWKDAMAYAQWAGKRIPTEAEWEAAARGVNGRIWPWGDKAIPNACNTREAGVGGTTPVYQFMPDGDTPEGVADMIGNVWEWTTSLFRAYPYDPSDGRENSDAMGWRVLRGGSFVNDLYRARSHERLDGDFIFYNNVGFRCASSLPWPSGFENGAEE